ncbi:hypothetical protein [Mucilaginibacter sp. UYCu711]|uniref:hypothetical protein n=1 Tax=Mucilaginibacter sp. UYCu711 TaxID=3156339 RepID=UPI003D22C390
MKQKTANIFSLSLRLPVWICIAFIGCFNTACHKIEAGNIIINADITKNPVYKKLDKERDYPEVGYYAWPKTSDVSYFNDRFQKLTDTINARNYNCKSFVIDSVLKINIGISDGEEWSGFTINCRNHLFDVKPYFGTDNIVLGKPEPTFDVIEQSLALNKSNYSIGDSIYGKVKFKIIEKGADAKVTHIAEGYFRSKVTKAP